MTKKALFMLFLMVSGIFLNFVSLHAEEQPKEQQITARDIMVMMDERPDGDDRRFLIHMILINKRGRKRERTVLSYIKDYGKDSKKLMYFQKPADVKGTGFLSWEYDDPKRDDDRWLYMPALKKIRRISGRSKNEYFMGTDFTYDDMGDRNVDEDEHRLLRDEKTGDFSCWVIESIPKEKDDMYTKKILWVRKDAPVVIKVEYYDKMGLIKILTVIDIRQQSGFWTVFHMEMDNISKKHKTVMKMEKVQYNIGLKDNIFRVSTLERGKIR